MFKLPVLDLFPPANGRLRNEEDGEGVNHMEYCQPEDEEVDLVQSIGLHIWYTGVHVITCVTRVLQECYESVNRVLQECYKSVTRVLHECYKSVTRALQECYKIVTRLSSPVGAAASSFLTTPAA